MSLFEIENALDNIQTAKPVNQKGFSQSGISEKEIQKIIIGRLKQEALGNKSDTPILGEELLFIAKEYSGWQDSLRRLDILALDKKRQSCCNRIEAG